MVSVTQSFYMGGMIISSLVCGHLSDKYGRLPVLWAAVVMESLAGLSCAFSFSIYQYMASRFILAIGAYGRYLTGFMLGNNRPNLFRSLSSNLCRCSLRIK
jgi:MFS family permease